MIPGGAVEAAVKRIGPAVTHRDIITILEAAAPHIERALTGRLLEAGWQEPEKPYIA